MARHNVIRLKVGSVLTCIDCFETLLKLSYWSTIFHLWVDGASGTNESHLGEVLSHIWEILNDSNTNKNHSYYALFAVKKSTKQAVIFTRLKKQKSTGWMAIAQGNVD